MSLGLADTSILAIKKLGSCLMARITGHPDPVRRPNIGTRRPRPHTDVFHVPRTFPKPTLAPARLREFPRLMSKIEHVSAVLAVVSRGLLN